MRWMIFFLVPLVVLSGCSKLSGIDLNPLTGLYDAWNQGRIISFVISKFWWITIFGLFYFIRASYRNWLNKGVDEDGRINTPREVIAAITYVILFMLLAVGLMMFLYQAFVNDIL